MKSALLAATALALAGCATAPPVVHTGPDPADAAAPTASQRYTPVTAGTVDYFPVDPKSWGEMNERVTPGAGRTR